MSKLGKRLIKAAKEVDGIVRGEITSGFVVHVPDDVDVKALRKRFGYSQSQFSRRFGFAIDALQDWEHDIRASFRRCAKPQRFQRPGPLAFSLPASLSR